MKCQQCQELLTDYQRGELVAADDAAVFDHISSCQTCRQEFDGQTELTAALRSAYASDLEMPPSLVANIRMAADADRRAAFGNVLRSWLRPVVLAPAAACIVLIAGVATYLHSGTTPPQVSADYLVRQHVVHTLDSQSGDRAWNAYLLTSSSAEETNAKSK